MVHGTIVTCTEFDSIRVEVQTEGHGLTIPAKSILALYALLIKCQRRVATLTLTPAVMTSKPSWDVSYHENMPGESSRVILANGPTPLAALVAMSEMLKP